MDSHLRLLASSNHELGLVVGLCGLEQTGLAWISNRELMRYLSPIIPCSASLQADYSFQE